MEWSEKEKSLELRRTETLKFFFVGESTTFSGRSEQQVGCSSVKVGAEIGLLQLVIKVLCSSFYAAMQFHFYLYAW